MIEVKCKVVIDNLPFVQALESKQGHMILSISLFYERWLGILFAQ